MDIESKIQSVYDYIKNYDDYTDLCSVLTEYVLYMHISFVYEKEMKDLRPKFSDPIRLEMEKNSLTFRLKDDITVYSINRNRPENEVYQNYYLNLIEIGHLNPSLSEYFDINIKTECKKFVCILLKILNPDDFVSENDLNEFFDRMQTVFKGNRHVFVMSELNTYYTFLKRLGYTSSVRSVYDNALGCGNLFDMKRDLKYYGIEKDPFYAKYSKIRMIINGKDPTSVICGDTLFCGGENKEKYDLVFSDMPLGTNILPSDRKKLSKDERFDFARGSFMRPDSLFVLDSLYHLADDGICLVSASQGFLFRPGMEKNLREYLVRNNYIEGIVSFPITFGVGFRERSVLVLRKNRTDSKIKMLNLTDFYTINKINPRIREISPEGLEKVFDIYYNQKENDNNFIAVSAEDIINNDFDLSFSRYADTDVSVSYDFRAGEEKITVLKKETETYKILLEENISRLKKY